MDAARFYAETFPDSAVGAVLRAPGDYPDGKKGDVLTVEFTVLGIPCVGLNGGPRFKHNEAFSFQIATDDQAETDRLWNVIVGNGGEESQCGWCRDKWGLSWQITPRVLLAAICDPDPAAAKRAFEVNEPRWLTQAQVTRIHYEQLVIFGGPAGIRDVGLLQSAIDRPRNKWGYGERDLAVLAAAYGFGLAKNHPFVDGNKRAPFAAIIVFMAKNGMPIEPKAGDATHTILELAAGNLSEDQLSEWIRVNIAEST